MDLSDFLSGTTVSKLSKKTGASAEQVRNVLKAAVPELVAGMSKNAASKDGADALHKALSSHAASGATSALKNVDVLDGAKIVKHVLGDKSSSTIKSMSKKLKVTPERIATILSSAAPLLMNALGNHAKKKKTKPEGLAGMLGSLLGSGGGPGELVGDLVGSLFSGGSSSSSSASKKKKKKPASGGGLLGDLVGSLVASNSSDKDDDDDDDNSSGNALGDILGSLLGGK